MLLKLEGRAGRADGEQNAADRGPSADFQVVLVAGPLVQVSLIKIDSKDGVEGRHAGGHARS